MAPPRFLIGCSVVLALLGASCGQSADVTASGRDASPAPVETSPVSSPSPGEFLEVGVDEASRTVEQPAARPGPAPKSLERWEWALRAKRGRLDVYSNPGPAATRRTIVDAENPWDQRIAFPIRDVRMRGGRAWYLVLLGSGRNGASGWIDGDDVTFERIRHQVVVDLSQRVLRHYRNSKLQHRFDVGIGAPATPTTTGRFFVWAHLDTSDASGPYGTYLLGLSGFSEVLQDWPGGGRMAIHGTADASDRGQPVSHGCARVFNPQMNQLRGIPMGTTVLIRR